MREKSSFGSKSRQPSGDPKGTRKSAAPRRPARTVLRCSSWGLTMIASSLALYGLSCAVVRSPLFVVEEIELETSGRLGEDEIRILSGIHRGMNLLAFDTEQVSRRLEAHPWIEHATVVKRLPAQVRIQVRGTEPALLVAVQGCLCYMDGKGRLLEGVPPGESLDLPLLCGLEEDLEGVRRSGQGRDVQQALSLLRVLQARPALGPVSEIRVDRSEGLSFVLEAFPVPVQVGWSGFRARMKRFEKALPFLAAPSGSVESVDLRFSGQIVVRECEEGRRQVPRGGRAETLAGSDPSFRPTT